MSNVQLARCKGGNDEQGTRNNEGKGKVRAGVTFGYLIANLLPSTNSLPAVVPLSAGEASVASSGCLLTNPGVTVRRNSFQHLMTVFKQCLQGQMTNSLQAFLNK